MPEGDRGGPVTLHPPKTRAITAFANWAHTLIVTDPPIRKRARKLAASTRRKRGRR